MTDPSPYPLNTERAIMVSALDRLRSRSSKRRGRSNPHKTDGGRRKPVSVGDHAPNQTTRHPEWSPVALLALGTPQAAGAGHD
jgi:hypothetical protein